MPDKKNTDILLIIPAYNEEGNISRVVDNLISNYKDLDYVVVNDGSRDNTAKICYEKSYNILDLPINLGLAGAFQAGMKYAYKYNYKYAIQFDGDGQHRAEYAYALKNKLEEGYDIVIASRFLENKKSFKLRMLGSRIISFAIFLTTGAKISDPTSGMRIYNRKSIEEFALNLNYAPEPDTISYLLKQGMKLAEIPAIMDERVSGTSYLSPIKAGIYMLRMLVSILFIQNFRKRESRYK